MKIASVIMTMKLLTAPIGDFHINTVLRVLNGIMGDQIVMIPEILKRFNLHADPRGEVHLLRYYIATEDIGSAQALFTHSSTMRVKHRNQLAELLIKNGMVTEFVDLMNDKKHKIDSNAIDLIIEYGKVHPEIIDFAVTLHGYPTACSHSMMTDTPVLRSWLKKLTRVEFTPAQAASVTQQIGETYENIMAVPTDGHYDYVIDGANVMHYGGNYKKRGVSNLINIVTKALSMKCGARVVIVLHKRHHTAVTSSNLYRDSVLTENGVTFFIPKRPRQRKKKRPLSASSSGSGSSTTSSGSTISSSSTSSSSSGSDGNRVYDDIYSILFAMQHKATIITNDMFGDIRDKIPDLDDWLKEHCISFTMQEKRLKKKMRVHLSTPCRVSRRIQVTPEFIAIPTLKKQWYFIRR